MTTFTFSPINMQFSSDFYVLRSSPKQMYEKSGKAYKLDSAGKKIPKPLAYAAFSVGISKMFVDTYSFPTWDTSKYFLESILEAIKTKAVEARAAKRTDVDLGANLPAFLASLSVGGRINKDDLVAWLASCQEFIVAYVQSRPKGDVATASKAASLTEWASKSAAPAPNWKTNEHASLDRLQAFLNEVAAEAEEGEFPGLAMLEAVSKKIIANRPSTETEDEV